MQPEIVNHLGQPIEVWGSDSLASLVVAALEKREPLSIVRMSDGEEKIFSYCKSHPPQSPMRQFEQEWRVRFGVEGITCGDMYARLDMAAKECTYFAPDGGEEFFLKHWPKRTPFAEIYFPNRWTRQERIDILKAAGSAIVVNRDMKIAERIRNSRFNPGVSVSWVSLKDWRQSFDAIADCLRDPAPLVLCSCGPASKFIVPKIAAQGKVVLDMGSGAPHFWCVREKQECGSDKHCGAVAKER